VSLFDRAATCFGAPIHCSPRGSGRGWYQLKVASRKGLGVKRPMSALGQKQTFAPQKVMSALPSKADMCGATRDVRLGPIADIPRFTRSSRQYVEHTDGDGGEMFQAVCKTWLEGTKSKSPSLQCIKARWLPVADPCARWRHIHRKTTTLVPTPTRPYRSIMSWLYMRIHPCETNPPIDPGLFVPWMAY
jgi:hypothetical protein